MAPGGRARPGSRSRRRARPCRRLRLAGEDDRLPGPALRPTRRWPDPEPRHEPAHGRGDHALRVRAPGRVEGERHPRLQAPLVGVDEGADGGRPAARDPARSWRSRSRPTASRRPSSPPRRSRRAWSRACPSTSPRRSRTARARSPSAAQLAAIESRIETAQRPAGRADRRPVIPLDTRLLLSANLNSRSSRRRTRAGRRCRALYSAQQLLNLAENVEKSRVVERPPARRPRARAGRRVLVGALVGLLVGAVAALAAEPFVRRRAVSSG